MNNTAKDSAPLKLSIIYCLPVVVPLRLEYTFLKIGVSSTDPRPPRGTLQILPTTLRIKNV